MEKVKKIYPNVADIKYIPNRLKCQACKSKLLSKSYVDEDGKVKKQGRFIIFCDDCRDARYEDFKNNRNALLRKLTELGQERDYNFNEFVSILIDKIAKGAWKVPTKKKSKIK